MKNRVFVPLLLIMVLSGCAMPWGDAAEAEQNVGGTYQATKDFVGGLNPLFKVGLALLTTAGFATGVIAVKKKKGKK